MGGAVDIGAVRICTKYQGEILTCTCPLSSHASEFPQPDARTVQRYHAIPCHANENQPPADPLSGRRRSGLLPDGQCHLLCEDHRRLHQVVEGGPLTGLALAGPAGPGLACLAGLLEGEVGALGVRSVLLAVQQPSAHAHTGEGLLDVALAEDLLPGSLTACAGGVVVGAAGEGKPGHRQNRPVRANE